MKKVLFLVLISMSLSNVHAQLTNTQVYNFEIGDVFQSSYAGSAGGAPPIETDTVIDKYYSGGADTLFYVMNHSQYFGAYMQSPAAYYFSTDTVAITNLNLPATHVSFNTCLPASDTAMTDDCNNTFERLHSNYDSTCFEPHIWYSDLFLGLGGPYFYYYDPTASGMGSEWYSKTLTYYNSSQYGECGTFYSFVGLNKLVEPINVRVSPNPATNELTISTELENWSYSIYSYNGKLISDGSNLYHKNTIDISQLNAGYYFIHVKDNYSTKTIPFIKK